MAKLTWSDVINKTAAGPGKDQIIMPTDNVIDKDYIEKLNDAEYVQYFSKLVLMANTLEKGGAKLRQQAYEVMGSKVMEVVKRKDVNTFRESTLLTAQKIDEMTAYVRALGEKNKTAIVSTILAIDPATLPEKEKADIYSNADYLSAIKILTKNIPGLESVLQKTLTLVHKTVEKNEKFVEKIARVETRVYENQVEMEKALETLEKHPEQIQASTNREAGIKEFLVNLIAGFRATFDGLIDWIQGVYDSIFHNQIEIEEIGDEITQAIETLPKKQ